MTLMGLIVLVLGLWVLLSVFAIATYRLLDSWWQRWSGLD